MSRSAIVIISATLLAGCAGPQAIGSIAGGECKLATTPEYAVRGATPYDQKWADETTEALVAGCNQPRPKARLVEMDRPLAKMTAPPPPPPVKKKWWQRKKVGA